MKPRIVGVALALLAAIAFGMSGYDVCGRWFMDGSYYGHGPLVLLAVAYFLWKDRERLRELPAEPSKAGGVVIVLSSLVFALGILEDVVFAQSLAGWGLLVGSVLAFRGWKTARAAWFPLAFLLFALPLPRPLIESFTFQLKLLAADLAVGAIEATGEAAILRGSTIHLADTSVVVEDVCSGLRTLITLLGMSALLAYLQETRWKAVLTCVLAVPIAIVANLVRILILCYLASIGNKAAFEGPLHEATGLAVYAVALILLLGIRSLPGGAPEEEAPNTDADSAEEVAQAAEEEPSLPAEVANGHHVEAGPADPLPSTNARWPVAVLVLVLALCAGLQSLVLLAKRQAPPPVRDVTRRIPLRIGPWRATEVPLDDQVYRILGTEDAILLRFQRAGMAGPPVDLYVVYATGDIFRVGHAPEQCYQGGGYEQALRERARLTTSAVEIPTMRLVFRRKEHQALVHYWYRLNGADVSSYLDYRLGSFLSRLKRYRSDGCMIRLTSAIQAEGGVEAAEERIQAFAKEALEPALAPIPGLSKPKK